MAINADGSKRWRMTTEEKTAAIQRIAANHEDNRAASRAANLHEGLEELVVAAMNEAFKADLGAVFALPKQRSRRP